MKVYRFFKVPEKYEKDEIDLGKKYTLYAMTNDKALAKRFSKERNMDKFIFNTHDGVDKEDYATMCNEERGAVLGLYPLTTIFNGKHTRRNAVKKEVLMTYYEKQLTDDPYTILDDEQMWANMPYPLIFKSKYRSMLEELQYTSYYKLMTMEFLPDHLAEKLAVLDDDYSAPAIEHDEVALFIKMIIDTL